MNKLDEISVTRWELWDKVISSWGDENNRKRDYLDKIMVRRDETLVNCDELMTWDGTIIINLNKDNNIIQMILK